MAITRSGGYDGGGGAGVDERYAAYYWDDPNKFLWTALHAAADSGQLESERALRRYGANVNGVVMRDDGWVECVRHCSRWSAC